MGREDIMQYPLLLASLLSGAMSNLWGVTNQTLCVLLVLMIVDILLGFLRCAIFHQSKYTDGGISSDALFKGSVRKCCMFLIIILAHQIDLIIGEDYCKAGSTMYFICTEGISIIENAACMGVPIPHFLLDLLEVLREKSDGGVSDDHSNSKDSENSGG